MTTVRAEKATRKGRQTDEAFREAARLVFARDGYLNAKISDIAAAAGRSVASFYNYYDTKADLLIALAEEFHAEASQLAALPYRAGLSGEEALREAVAGFWRTYAKRRGELIGIFQAAMVEGRFRDRWLELRGEAITRIATAVRKAQADGYCPGVDPVMTASALSAMLEHFCYIWVGQGGEKDVPFDADRALDARIRSFETAFGMQREAPEAFDLSKETEETLKLYGLDHGKSSFDKEINPWRRPTTSAASVSSRGGCSNAACALCRSGVATTTAFRDGTGIATRT